MFTPAIRSNKNSDFQNYATGITSPVQIEENESDDHTSKNDYEQFNITSTINNKSKVDTNIHIKQEVASVIQGMKLIH